MRKSGQGRFFIVTIMRHGGRPPEAFFVQAEDRDTAKRRGAWFARVQPDRVVDVADA